MRLTGPQMGELMLIIKNSFNPLTFQTFLTIRIDKDLNDYSPAIEFPNTILNVIKGANMEGWVPELLDALKSERPRSKELQMFLLQTGEVKDFTYTEDPKKQESLERIVNLDPGIEPEIFMNGLFRAKKCFCRIEVYDEANKVSYGTGFLISADVVITNFHVMKDVIDHPELAPKVKCRFDYQYNADGSLNTGMELGLSQDAVFHYRKYSQFDEHPEKSIEVAWPIDQLDYALIRLERSVGEEPLGINASLVQSSQENIRGWIKKVNTDTAALASGASMVILQHPKSQPIKIAIGLSKVIGSDANFRRVRYDINTEPGSSGAGCFDISFNWVALHNLGDPEWIPTYNQGIPARAIIEDLKSNGFTDFDICK